MMFFFFFFKQKTAYEMRISDWSSDVCSSDLQDCGHGSIRRRVRSLPLAQVPAPAAIGHAARRAEPRSGSEGVAVPMHRNILSASLLAALALAGCGERNAARADPASASGAAAGAIGRAHVSTPVTNAHRVCRLLL